MRMVCHVLSSTMQLIWYRTLPNLRSIVYTSKCHKTRRRLNAAFSASPNPHANVNQPAPHICELWPELRGDYFLTDIYNTELPLYGSSPHTDDSWTIWLRFDFYRLMNFLRDSSSSQRFVYRTEIMREEWPQRDLSKVLINSHQPLQVTHENIEPTVSGAFIQWLRTMPHPKFNCWSSENVLMKRRPSVFDLSGPSARCVPPYPTPLLIYVYDDVDRRGQNRQRPRHHTRFSSCIHAVPYWIRSQLSKVSTVVRNASSPQENPPCSPPTSSSPYHFSFFLVRGDSRVLEQNSSHKSFTATLETSISCSGNERFVLRKVDIISFWFLENFATSNTYCEAETVNSAVHTETSGKHLSQAPDSTQSILTRPSVVFHNFFGILCDRSTDTRQSAPSMTFLSTHDNPQAAFASRPANGTRHHWNFQAVETAFAESGSAAVKTITLSQGLIHGARSAMATKARSLQPTELRNIDLRY